MVGIYKGKKFSKLWEMCSTCSTCLRDCKHTKVSEIISPNIFNLERGIRKLFLKTQYLSKDIKYLSSHKLIQKLLKKYKIG